MPLKPIKDTALLKQARERFKLADTSDGPQSKRERAAISFEAGNQWPADILAIRMGQNPTQGQPSVPARPTLVINKVREPVRQVLNQERESDIGVELVPADDFGDLGITPDDTEVTLREGLVRRIQRESIAADARTWAFKRAVIAGRGYYIVRTRYLPGKTFDQEVYVERIYNQAGVLLDPSHEMPDGSDAGWEFIGTWMPWDRYIAEYPQAKDQFAETSEADFVAMTEAYPDWYRESSEYINDQGKTEKVKQQAVRVVSYWYTEYVTRELCQMADGRTLYREEVPEGEEPQETRMEPEKRIKYCLIGGGVQILEETDWSSEYMPIVKVVGDEILPYDEQRRCEGMVEPAMDSQRGLNYMISKQVEQVGLTPIAPLMVDPEAISGYEAMYDQANIRPIPRLPYRTYNDEGAPFLVPTRPPVDPQVLALSQSVALFDQMIQATTAVSDPAMGQTDSSVKSDRHARTLISESRLSTSNFLDNLARSIRYEGQIENSLLYPIYGSRPGRMVRILTGEGEGQMMQVANPEHGQPVPNGQPTQQAQQAQAMKVGKLTKDAHFNVIVKVAKNTENRRQAFVGMFGEIIAADPSQMGVGGDLLYQNMDIPHAKQLAKRQRANLLPHIQQMLAAEESGQIVDPAAMAQIQQLTEQLKAAEAAIQELAKDQEGHQIKAQTELEVTKLNAQRDLELEQMKLAMELKQAEIDLEKARMDNATKQYIADVDAKTKGQIQAAEHQHDEMATASQLAHEAEQKSLDRDAQARMTAEQQAHDAALAEGAQEHESVEAEANRQAAKEQPSA